MYKKTQLSNGLRVVTARMPHMKSVSLGIWIGAGGRYENERNAGISHFLEHMVFKGTKQRSTSQIKGEIEGVGGALNGFTSEEYTCYLVKVAAKHMRHCMDVLSDMVLNASVRQEEFERERMVIMEEIRMHLDIPMHYVHELLNKLLWPKQPLGMDLAGTFKTVAGISRADIVKYRDRFYHPANIVIAACGALEHSEVVEAAEEIFGKRKKIARTGFKKAAAVQRRPQIELLFKETEQTHISLGVHSLPRQHPQRFALALTNIILGANMSSRLFDQIREKRGLAYEIGSSLRRFSDTGAFVVNAGVENGKAARVAELVLKELKRIARFKVSAKELRAAKEFFIGQLYLALEDTMDHMLWVGEGVAAADKVKAPEEIVKSISSVRAEDILKISEKLFKGKNLNLAIIGPLKDKERERIEKVVEGY